jgi:2,4-dienoyl-CoA reductase-like NADH-dependent reductase (Old Yellow Enzyme family)
MTGAFAPARLGPVQLRNRIVKAATFEGMTPQGLVSDALVDFHRAPARGGVGMTTLAYCSVSPEGRTYRHQIWMRPEALPGLRQLTDAVHAEGAAAAIQLGHAGWFANPKATGQQAIGPSRKFSPYGLGWPRAMERSDFARVLDDYRRAAVLAVDAGFDALEIHMGHGYLLSQLLSPHTNRRADRYGGSIENRARFPREVARAVRDAVGDRAAVYAKLNMTDGFRGGLDLVDGVAAAQMLDADGTLDALQLTGGFTARTPMYLLRGDVPLHEMLELERDPIRRLGLRLVAPRMMKPYPFTEAFFRSYARQVRDAVSMPLMLLGGISKRATVDQAMADGFEFVAMARALLREPGFVIRMQREPGAESLCVHCNKCVTEMDRAGTRCVFT